MKVVAVGLAVLLAAGCESEPATTSSEPELELERLSRPRPAPSAQLRDHALLVLVNTPEELYRVDPDTLAVTRLGTFSFPDGRDDKITDIAMDRSGRMWGVGFEAVYRIDPKTFACTRLAHHPGRALNALSIMTSSMIAGRETPDIMIAAEIGTQAVYQVDPGTGALKQIGDLGGALSSSGDLTWAPGIGAIMITTGGGQEGLSRLHPDTFVAEPIGGGWAFSKVRGLTMLPRGLLLGVSEHGEMIEIDPRTGNASVRVTHPLVFYGGAIGWE
jgi:hypothetical protein